MYCDIFSGNFKGNILIPEKLFITSRLRLGTKIYYLSKIQKMVSICPPQPPLL